MWETSVKVCTNIKNKKTIKKIKELRMYIYSKEAAAVQQIKIIKNEIFF
jgi:hypothetical protein